MLPSEFKGQLELVDILGIPGVLPSCAYNLRSDKDICPRTVTTSNAFSRFEIFPCEIWTRRTVLTRPHLIPVLVNLFLVFGCKLPCPFVILGCEGCLGSLTGAKRWIFPIYLASQYLLLGQRSHWRFISTLHSSLKSWNWFTLVKTAGESVEGLFVFAYLEDRGFATLVICHKNWQPSRQRGLLESESRCDKFHGHILTV